MRYTDQIRPAGGVGFRCRKSAFAQGGEFQRGACEPGSVLSAMVNVHRALNGSVRLPGVCSRRVRTRIGKRQPAEAAVGDGAEMRAAVLSARPRGLNSPGPGAFAVSSPRRSRGGVPEALPAGTAARVRARLPGDAPISACSEVICRQRTCP